MNEFIESAGAAGLEVCSFLDRIYVRECISDVVRLTDFLKHPAVNIGIVMHENELFLEYPQISCSEYTKGLKKSDFWPRLIRLPVNDMRWFYLECKGASCPQPYPVVAQISVSDSSGRHPGTYHCVSGVKSTAVTNAVDIDFELSGSKLVGHASQLDARFFDKRNYEFIAASEQKARALREELTLSARVEFETKTKCWIGLGEFSRFDVRVWRV